jgi:two-component system, NarL family, response regulator YdfI
VIRVLIFAASPAARAGFEHLLSARDIKVVDRVAHIDALADRVTQSEPDVVLVEASDESSGEILEALLESGLASDTSVVAILEGDAAAEKSSEALQRGIRAVLPDDVTPDQLVAALHAAAAGLVVLHPTEVGAALSATARATQPITELPEPLTPREREVLQMLASGLGNKQIAARLNISEHTAKFHVASILGKLGAGSRTEAVALGIRRGLVFL